MALRVDKTPTSVVDEAYRRLNIPLPTGVERTKGETQILQGAVDLVARSRTWKILEESAVIVLTPYVSRYGVAADFNKIIECSLLWGNTGAMQAASASSITLDASESLTVAQALGAPVFMLTGNAAGYSSKIVSYDTGTKVAGISPDWDVTPTSGNYLVATTERPVNLVNNDRLKLLNTPGSPKKMRLFEDEIWLSPAPDAGPYVLSLQYQVSTRKLDLTATRLTSIYNEWFEALVWAVAKVVAIARSEADKVTSADASFKDALTVLGVEDDSRLSLGR